MQLNRVVLVKVGWMQVFMSILGKKKKQLRFAKVSVIAMDMKCASVLRLYEKYRECYYRQAVIFFLALTLIFHPVFCLFSL